MTIKHCFPEIPKKYGINRYFFKCNNCSMEFEFLLPNGNYLVKYEEVEGFETRWLPTYGKGGYLDLMKKLLPDFDERDEITVQIGKRFNELLQSRIELSPRGSKFTLARYKPTCPNCKSVDLITLEEEILASPEVEWLRIDCELMCDQE